MISVLMVDGVGSLPAEIRYQQDGMQNVSHGIAQIAVAGESPVSTFMGQDPKAHGDSSSDGRVESPKGERQEIFGRKHRQHVDSEESTESCTSEGNSQVTKRESCIGFEAIGWNDGPKIF